MFKLVLGFGVFILSSYIGFVLGDTFRKRSVQLKELRKGITILQNEVLYNNTPLPDAFYSIGHKTKDEMKDMFNGISDRLNCGRCHGVYDAFKDEYVSLEDDIYLTKDDRVLLEDFFKNLGDSGVYGQERIFSLTLESLKLNLVDAEENRKKNTKMYRYLGVCIGAMIGIFLI